MQHTKRSDGSSDTKPGSKQKLSAIAALEAADVVAWLRTHTDFFLEYPDLLAVLALPNESGTTISFAQRQASLLRKRNSDLRGRLQALLANAETNDALFEKTRALSLTLQRAESQSDLNAALADDLVTAFAADHLACYLQVSYQQMDISHKPTNSAANNGRSMLHWSDKYPLAELFDPTAARCVTLRTRELDQLFPSRQSRDEGSAVLIPLPNSNAMLAIGSDNRERFSNDMGMLFVDFIGELVDVTVQRLLRSPASSATLEASTGVLTSPPTQER